MKNKKLIEALARKQKIQEKKTIPSGNAGGGWKFNDQVSLAELGHKGKTNRRMREVNFLKDQR